MRRRKEKMEKKELNNEKLEQVNAGSVLLIGSFVFAGLVCAGAAIYGTISGMK